MAEPTMLLGHLLEEAASDCLSALAGVDACDVNLRDHRDAWASIEAFAAKVQAAERERCAKIVDVPPGTEAWEVIGGEEGLTMLRELAAQIRA